MNNPTAKPSIEKLETYKPNFGKSKINNLIRLSANESALGTSLKAIKVLNSFTHNLNRYPPQVSDDLISAIATRYYLDKKKIILGNGSDELISIILIFFQTSASILNYVKQIFLGILCLLSLQYLLT